MSTFYRIDGETLQKKLHASRFREDAQCHLETTVTVTLLFAMFESSCGRTVWTEAVFTICWATLDALTVITIVACPDRPPFCMSRIGHVTIWPTALQNNCPVAGCPVSGDNLVNVTEPLTYVSEAGSASTNMMPP